MSQNRTISASFRDPSGFLFHRGGVLYRQINQNYKENYEHLINSGLYEQLIKKKWLIPHQPVEVEPAEPDSSFCIIQPEEVKFISYPYEWCFSQLKDAALLTLSIQKTALEHEMVLKDASAYNIQFHHGSPVLIDTLSFEIYKQGLPWVAYRQFCQHFLAPIALMSKCDTRLSELLRVYIDGIPLDLAGKLLPWNTHLNFGLLTHVHLHARAQKHYADKPINTETSAGVSRTSLMGLIDSLESTIKQLQWQIKDTEWGDYYEETNYNQTAFDDKKRIVSEYLTQIQPSMVWDLGANTGIFSRIASQWNILTISFDIDPGAVEKNYITCREQKELNLIPLVLDLTNPSPAIGWENKERMSFIDRAPADAVLALALIHHLAISNNVPLARLAVFFYHIGKWVIIEFIPKTDSQVQRLLSSRKDIFVEYNQDSFESAFTQFFTIHDKRQLNDSQRIIYLLKNKNDPNSY